MPAAIGITARRSADASQRDDRPWPSDPSTRARRSTPATASSMGTESGPRVSATVVKPRRGEVRQGVVPVGDPGPRRGEHRAHADLDRAAVERVGAPRCEQHGVEAEGGAGPEDRADVGVVDQVLEHQHRACSGEHVVHGRERPPAQRRQRPAMDVEAGDLLDQRLGQDVAGRGGARRARRRGRRASAAPSGTTAPRGRPRSRGAPPSPPRPGRGRARPPGSCGARRRAGRGSRPAAGRRGRPARRSRLVRLPCRSGRSGRGQPRP